MIVKDRVKHSRCQRDVMRQTLSYEPIKEPLINHRYFITIDKPVHENSLFRVLAEADFL